MDPVSYDGFCGFVADKPFPANEDLVLKRTPNRFAGRVVPTVPERLIDGRIFS